MTAPSIGLPTGPDAGTPLLLLPVHVQTRFVGGTELLVRIYPDQIAVDSHEAPLTDQEVAEGQQYWTVGWSGDAQAAWRLLATRYGATRAAWIALQLTPTNIGQQPSVPPVFPTVTRRASSWEQPAIADALPDAWTVVLVSGTTSSLFRGSAITTPLAVSLTPNGSGFPAGSSVDPGLRWMVDFDAAVAAGMALRIPITAAQYAAGFDRLLVYGLRARDSQAGATLAHLLDAHHYTDGLAFVGQGSATNNTPDAPSAYSRKDPNETLSYATERLAPLTADPESDGAVFAALTGVPLTTFDHVAGADAMGARNGTDMLSALWPSTLGYFLGQMMAQVFSPAQIEAAREYVLAHAIPRGPVSAFRVGTTPYGVLPVTSLVHYAAPTDGIAGIEPGLVDFVKRLWPTWLASSANAPHFAPGGDPDQSLMSVLGMDASSMTFQGRPVIGPTFLWNLFGFLGSSATLQGQWWQSYTTFGRAVLDGFGYTSWNPRVITLGFGRNSFPITFPTVDEQPLSETTGLESNYIDWLRTATVADIQAENYPGTKPTALLYKILRQSVLIEYTNLASQSAPWNEAELVGVQAATTTATPWQILEHPATPNPAVSWAEYLQSTTSITQLNDLKASLGRLALLPTGELDRLLTETLDACSHRLDVWATAIATSLLQRARARQNANVFLGCYGWVESIHPEATRVAVAGKELQQVQTLDAARKVRATVPLQPMAANGGSILAPSSAQSATAAVLRSGFLTHAGTSEANLLSIDLSSERVRKALWLIAGVQQGQSLNALLGYLFEDAMHAAQLDVYVTAFREAYPIIGTQLTASSAPAEAVAASNVVDGLALRTAWDNGTLVAGGNWGTGLPAPGTDQNAVITILGTLDDYADALGDLSIAETVFQMMRGNFGGAALMDAISRGSRPPKPAVVDTPRGGTDLMHRLALLFAGAPVRQPSWSGITTHPRAAAEPWLDAWLTSVLPNPAIVRCVVRYQDAGGTAQARVIALKDLDLGPLDFVALSDATDVPLRSELESRILYAAGVSVGAQGIAITFQSDPALPAGSMLFPDALFLAQQLRRLIGSARALAPQDMTTPERNAATAGGSVDLTDLRARAAAVTQSLDQDIAALTTALTGTVDAMRAALVRCSAYGVNGSVPSSATGADASLLGQAQRVLAVLAGRRAKVVAADPADAFATIFGDDFVVLPRFVAPDQTTLHSAFAASASLVASDPVAPDRWFRQLTHVRPSAGRLDLALSAAQALTGGLLYPPVFTLGQVPPVSGTDRWLALPIDPSQPPAKGRVAFACVTSGDPTSATAYAGLLLDEWIERVPTTSENASLAFQFDEPDARAPQALLLAVCPDGRKTWDDTIIQAILSETLDLAKIRTVDLASVQQVGQILPALYFALNLQGATVSTQFATLVEATNVGNAR